MYDSLIAEARAALPRYGVYRNWLFRPIRELTRFFRSARIDRDLWETYAQLCDHGTVVWGAVVQVNPALFTGKVAEAPANFVFGTDPYFDSRPAHLVRIARRISTLKATFPEDTLLANLAAIVTDETNYVSNWRVPYSVADGHTVFLSSVLLHTLWLPELWSPPLAPFVVAPKLTPVSMPLPFDCWPRALCRRPELTSHVAEDARLSAKSISETQHADDRRIATERAHRPRRAEELVPGAADAIISLTPGCAAMMRRIASDGPPHWHVQIGGDANYRAMEILPGPPPRDQQVVSSQGIQIAIPKNLLKHVRGTVVEYQKSPLGEGFRFIEP